MSRFTATSYFWQVGRYGCLDLPLWTNTLTSATVLLNTCSPFSLWSQVPQVLKAVYKYRIKNQDNTPATYIGGGSASRIYNSLNFELCCQIETTTKFLLRGP